MKTVNKLADRKNVCKRIKQSNFILNALFSIREYRGAEIGSLPLWLTLRSAALLQQAKEGLRKPIPDTQEDSFRQIAPNWKQDEEQAERCLATSAILQHMLCNILQLVIKEQKYLKISTISFGYGMFLFLNLHLFKESQNLIWIIC